MDLLTGLPMMAGAVTRQINAENPTGEKGGACRWAPDPNDPNLPFSRAASDLGKGAKPFSWPIFKDLGSSMKSS